MKKIIIKEIEKNKVNIGHEKEEKKYIEKKYIERKRKKEKEYKIKTKKIEFELKRLMILIKKHIKKEREIIIVCKDIKKKNIIGKIAKKIRNIKYITKWKPGYLSNNNKS